MERLWEWHKDGKELNNIDGFIANLRKTNNQKGILFKHQMLRDGDITRSVAMLLAASKQNTQSTDKVATAALEMNKYLNLYYGQHSNEVLNVQRLAIPAMLDVLESNIQKNVPDSNIVEKAHLIVSKTKQVLNNDTAPLRRNIYDSYVSAYKAEIRGNAPQKRGLHLQQKICEI